MVNVWCMVNVYHQCMLYLFNSNKVYCENGIFNPFNLCITFHDEEDDDITTFCAWGAVIVELADDTVGSVMVTILSFDDERLVLTSYGDEYEKIYRSLLH